MKNCFLIITVFFSTYAFAQTEPDTLCANLNEIDTLRDSEISELQKEFNKFFKKISEVSKASDKLPKDWLKQRVILSLGECYMRGIHVKKDMKKAIAYFRMAENLGNEDASHIIASLQLFKSNDIEKQKKGFHYFENEYKSGSAYAAGKLGWAYQAGLGTEPNLQKAIEFYRYAAERGMTYWQYLLAHAYEQGYLGFQVDKEKANYWIHYKPKVHVDVYECWIAQYYVDGIYPSNERLFSEYDSKCKSIKSRPATAAN